MLSLQCELLQVSRASFYAKPIPGSPEELALMNRIDRFHLEHPEYGSRRLGHQFGISRDQAKRRSKWHSICQ